MKFCDYDGRIELDPEVAQLRRQVQRLEGELAQARDAFSALRADNPEAKFRVVPWLNSNQRKILERERKLSDKLAEALGNMIELIEANAPDGYYTEAPSIGEARAALAQHAAARVPHTEP